MNKKILIVDDEPLNSFFIKELLVDFGCEILVANNGVQALEKIQKFNPDLVLLDIKMPLMTGMEVLQLMSERQLTSDTSFIMVSAYHNQQNKRQAFCLGAQHFINKPIISEKLIRVVEECLED
ncbi:MAG: response regulator [Bacteroidales bacterium]|nr:response regulator [Bacteroidales bacterium]